LFVHPDFAEQRNMSVGLNKLICYPILDTPPVVRPAPPKRDWMTQSPGRFAYRCLPLVIANSHGWELLVDRSFSATWSGGTAAAEMQVSFLDGERSVLPASHFGMGVLTFQVGYLFETQERYNLWVSGPINEPKDGIVPLCGVVEADWGPYTFTMNWMFTRPGTVRFERGEPFCHVFPIPRQLLSAVQPEIRDLEEVPEKAATLASWRAAREELYGRARKGEIKSADQAFGMHYFRGETPSGEAVVPDHVTRLMVKPFEDLTSRQVSRSAADGLRRTGGAHAGAKPAAPPAERVVRAHFMSNGSRSSTVAFPDPFFSASIACAGGVDETVRRAVAPIWLRLRQEREESQSYLWFQRHHERLAIHLHGPEEEASVLRGWLEEFSPEWSAYRRSDAALGDRELLLDHRYASLATLCLARGCDFVLASLNGDGGITPGSRRTMVLRALLAGLSALELPQEMRFSYLAYHRDSVLRSHGTEALPQAVSSLDAKADASPQALQRFRGILAEAWNGGADAQPALAELGSWQRSLSGLFKYAGSAAPAFAPLYTACHGIANQAGLPPLDEAFLCHLLVRARPPET
jgi:hypothetical protein